MDKTSTGQGASVRPASLRLDYARLDFPRYNIATVQVDSGYSVDQNMATDIHRLIYRHLGCNYGMIEDRARDYSIFPVPIFQFFNNWQPLQAIAIVTHRTASKTMAEIDRSLSRKPLAVFDDMASALVWLNRQLSNNTNTL